MSKKDMAVFKNRLYEDAIRRERNKNNNEVFKVLLVIACYSLHENHNFGFAKLEHFMDKVNETLDYLNDGDITMADIEEVLDDECGIKVTGRQRVTPFKN